jgi:signal peptide peptidase SppA
VYVISLLSQPWLITDESFTAMCKIAEQFDLQSLVSKGPDGAQAAIPLFQDEYDDDQGYLMVENGIGIVSIDGPIVKDPNLFDRLFFGASDMDAISAALEEAGERPDVKGVLLDINSPGGTVIGTPELASTVRQIAREKYVYAFTDGMMASAAYWIGSQADAIYATPSSRVGSVGVLQTVTNRTDLLKMRGVTVETFSAGKYKSAGLPHAPLTDEQRAMIQANVDEIHGDFKAAVLARGRQIPPEAMEGQDFTGKNAAAKGMVTGLVQNRKQVIGKLMARCAG